MAQPSWWQFQLFRSHFITSSPFFWSLRTINPGVILLSILQMRILSPRSLHNFLKFHLTGQWRRWALNHSFLTVTPIVFLPGQQFLGVMITKTASGIMRVHRYRTTATSYYPPSLPLRDFFEISSLTKKGKSAALVSRIFSHNSRKPNFLVSS